MPIVALGPGRQRLNASELDDDHWLHIRRAHDPLICTGCGGPMHTVVLPMSEPAAGSPEELRFFRHNPGAGEICRALGFDESPQHHALKRRLAEGARRAGWSAEYEVQVAKDCRADVVATEPKTGKTRALEAQLAPLNMNEALARHERYEREFGDCTWTHTRGRDWSSQVPSLQVDIQDHDTVIGGVLIDLYEGIDAPPAPIRDVIADVLTNQLRWVFMREWGTYVQLGTRVPTTPTRRPRAPRQITGIHVRRFCERMRLLGPEARALVEAGFIELDGFLAELDTAHRLSEAHREREWSERQHAALALAYLYPVLKDRPIDVVESLRACDVSIN